MPRTSDLPRRPRPGHLRAVFVALGVASAVPAGAGAVAAPPSWTSGVPVAVAAEGGQARFTVPTPSPGSRTLVIVSPLARGAGPFPLRLAARSINPNRLGPPKTEPEGDRKAPALAFPALPKVPSPVRTMPPRERTFHLMVRDGDVASASNYQAVTGRLRAVGHRVQVYVDDHDLDVVGPEVLRDLVATFDDRVFPVAARNFGQARDVDKDGRFTVLMSGWLTHLAGGRYAVDGFVRGADLDPGLAPPFSNHADMMCLSTSLQAGPHLRTVLAHEYTHAVTFSAKNLPGHDARPLEPEEEGWVDEGLAHLVEDLHGFSRSNLDYRVSAFLSSPERYQLVVPDYYAAGLFRGHGNRGGTYLFLRWCADRVGAGLVPALVRSEYLGVPNLEAATGRRFADLYREWSLGLFTSGFDPARVDDESGFTTLDTRGPFDDWQIAGPRTYPVAPDGPEASWASAGTASRYLVVESSATGALEVVVTGPASAEVQVTAYPLPDDLPALELSAEAAPGPDGARWLKAEVRERNGAGARLTSIAWEPLVPAPDPHAPGFRKAALDSLGIADAFGTSTLPGGGTLGSRPIAPLPPAALGPIVVKAVATDAKGRRVAAWAEIPTSKPGPAADEPADR